MGVLGLIPPIALAITPVPITLQSLGVMLAGGLLGSRLGALSQLIFLLIVGVGAPLLAGGRGGTLVYFLDQVQDIYLVTSLGRLLLVI